MPTTTTLPPTYLAIKEHLNSWFYKPDLEAAEIAMAVAAAHRMCEADPVWLMVIGPSGSGKTSIIINLVRSIAESHVLGDITEKTFISHFGNRQCGLLMEVKNGIFLFKDFTTILSKRDDAKNEIFAQLREIYDGCWKRNTGAVEAAPMWEGKISAIAVATPAIERAWSLRRELGERFISLRWDRVGGVKFAREAAKQRGKEKLIEQRTRELGRDFINQAKGAGQWVEDEQLAQLCAHFAETVAILRGHVVRDTYGQREIIDIPNMEEPTRLNKSFELLASAHAALFQRVPAMESAKIVSRIAWDSIPANRARFIRCLVDGAKLSQAELSKFIGVHHSTVQWVGDELVALGAVEMTKDAASNIEYKITPTMTDLLLPIRAARDF